MLLLLLSFGCCCCCCWTPHFTANEWMSRIYFSCWSLFWKSKKRDQIDSIGAALFELNWTFLRRKLFAVNDGWRLATGFGPNLVHAQISKNRQKYFFSGRHFLISKTSIFAQMWTNPNPILPILVCVVRSITANGPSEGFELWSFDPKACHWTSSASHDQ